MIKFFLTYFTDFCRYEITQPVEPRHVGFEIPGLFHILKGRLQSRTLLGEGLDELLRADIA